MKGSRWSWLWRWGLGAAFLWVALAAWSLSAPVGAEPDADYHLARLYCSAGQLDCVQNTTPRDQPCYRADVTIPADCSDLGTRSVPRGDVGDPESSRYPPFFYPMMSVFIGDNLAETTIGVRLANSTLTVVLALASVALTAAGLRRAVALSWLVASVPLGINLLSGMNPNAWAVIGIAAFWGPLLSFLTAPGGLGAIWGPPVSRWLQASRAAFVLLCSGLALAGRSEPQVLMPIAAGAITLFALPTRVPPWPTVKQYLRLLLPMAIPLLAVFAYWNYSRGKVAAIGRYVGGAEAIEGSNYAGWDVLQQVLNLVTGFTGLPSSADWRGGLGHETPKLAILLVIAAYAGAVLMGLSQMYGRKALAWISFSAAVFALMAWLWSGVSASYFQPRYFLPVSFVFVGLALLPRPDWVDPSGWVRRGASSRVGSPGQWGLVLSALVVANSVALLATLLRYVKGLTFQSSRSPLGQNAPDLNPGDLLAAGSPSWWWQGTLVSPFGAWILGSLAFAAVAGMVWWLLIRPPMPGELDAESELTQVHPPSARPQSVETQLA